MQHLLIIWCLIPKYHPVIKSNMTQVYYFFISYSMKCTHAVTGMKNTIWVRSRNWGCLVTWFCYQLIAKPGNKTAAVSWPDPYDYYFLKRKVHCTSFDDVHFTTISLWDALRIGELPLRNFDAKWERRFIASHSQVSQYVKSNVLHKHHLYENK